MTQGSNPPPTRAATVTQDTGPTTRAATGSPTIASVRVSATNTPTDKTFLTLSEPVFYGVVGGAGGGLLVLCCCVWCVACVCCWRRRRRRKRKLGTDNAPLRNISSPAEYYAFGERLLCMGKLTGWMISCSCFFCFADDIDKAQKVVPHIIGPDNLSTSAIYAECKPRSQGQVTIPDVKSRGKGKSRNIDPSVVYYTKVNTEVVN